MIVFGSGSIVSQLTQHGLIDEYQSLSIQCSSEADATSLRACRKI
jgi:dihydrofolate reductase